MSGADPTATLQSLREAAERISANLVELEIDAGRQLLEASALAGLSGARWADAGQALTELWRRRGLLDDLLARAERLRGSRRADELRALLDGTSIELSSADVPLRDRTLLGTAQEVTRCSPEQLLRGMSAAFDEVKTVVSSIGAAWETLIPRLDAARRLLDETSRLADGLGQPDRGDLDAAARALQVLTASVTTDPLSVEARDVERLLTTVEALKHDLDASAALKRGFEAEMLRARESLQRLQGAVRDERAAGAELAAKIAGAAGGTPDDDGEAFEGDLPAVVRLARQGAWQEARRALEDWTVHTNAALARADRALAAHRAPIEARNQLRALLEAYQVKAARLGLIEDRQAAELYARAHEALYSAPTDLAAASQLVRRYQQVLTGAQPTPEPLR